jgi:hypothetical protein
MSTWYRVNRWQNTILPVEVVKETPSFVTIINKSYFQQEQRVAKGGEFFLTFAEARENLMKYWAQQAANHKQQVDAANRQWGKLYSQEGPDKESK